jgi:hypothetical protein
MNAANEMDSAQETPVEAFLRDKDLVECQRYHARLTREACKRYRKRNPDKCRGCQVHFHIGRQKIWTRERLLQAVKIYTRDREGPVTLDEFANEFGLNSTIIKREWGSWRALCASAKVQSGWNGKSNGDRAHEPKTLERRISLDLSDVPDLHEALIEEAERNRRRLEEQILCILRGWFA